MRIPAKVSLGVGILALSVFGTIAIWQAQVERRDLVRAVEDEMMLTARAMRVASQNALRDRQIGDVDLAVSALEEIRADVDVMLFAPDGSLRAASAGAVASASSFDRVALGRLSGERPHLNLAQGRGVLVVPLVVNEDAQGWLAIVRPLSDVAADLQRETTSLAIAVVGFTLLVVALVYGLGEVVVGRPLSRLSAAMERVPAGEFHPSLETHRDDEIGQVVRAFVVMLQALERARGNLEAEQDARRRSMRALQDADRLVTIGQLSAGIAHEIGSPLLVLHGRARRLLRHADNADEVRAAAQLIADQAERITRIVVQLLDVARRRTQSASGKPEDAVRAVVELLGVEARRKNVSLELEAAPGVEGSMVESDSMQQITLNLTRNALYAAGDGGHVVLRLSRGALRRPGARGETDSLRLVVEDDGPGIEPELQSRLFEPFFTTRAGEGGTGLGLSIVGALVNELGGTVNVSSELGRGSRFTVDLPWSCSLPASRVDVA